MTTLSIICPETLEDCDRDLCQHRINSADKGNPTKTRDVELACGHSWLEAKIHCDECGESTRLKDVSFAVCRRCRAVAEAESIEADLLGEDEPQ